MEDRRNITLADELGHLRAEIKALKIREAELREQLIADGGAPQGEDYQVEVVEQTRRSFDRKALPPEIAEDPRYWKTSTSHVVRVKSLHTDAVAAEASLIDEDDT
jgi:hypothetical protein